MLGTRRSDSRTDAVDQLAIFDGCSPRARKRVAALAEITRAKAGDVLTLQRYAGALFHVVIDGTARVEIGRQPVGKVGPGDPIGEIGLLQGRDRSATVIAETPMRLLTFDADGFGRLMAEHPLIAERIRDAARARLGTPTPDDREDTREQA